MSEQLLYAPTEQTEQLSQQEVDARFEMITQLIDLNSQLDGDLQAELALELRAERDRLVGELMDNPVEAFRYEFALLRQLYEGRTRTDVDSMNNTVSQFVTRDPSRQKADLHFRHIEYDSGNVEEVVEVPRKGVGLPFFISAKNDEMRITSSVYHRGRYDRVEVDPASEAGKQLLREFFTHTIVASDLVYNRTPDQIQQADQQAVLFMMHKYIRDRTI
ncbi:MAG: hypothetical protein WBK76_05840 [Candidatus Saccharimonadales bacterium]